MHSKKDLKRIIGDNVETSKLSNSTNKSLSNTKFHKNVAVKSQELKKLDLVLEKTSGSLI
jgi:hypothetical protein